MADATGSFSSSVALTQGDFAYPDIHSDVAVTAAFGLEGTFAALSQRLHARSRFRSQAGQEIANGRAKDIHGRGGK